jgi:hypothetical protein
MSEEERCPQCQNTYKQLGVHWGRSSTCEGPEPTERQHALLYGALIVGGGVVQGQGNESAQIRLYSTNEQLLDWYAEELYPLTGLTAVTVHPQEANAFTDYTDVDDSYLLYTRTLSCFNTYHRAWYRDSEKVIPTGIDRSSALLTSMYAYRGWLDDGAFSYNPRPRIAASKSPATDDFFESLFAPFDPVVEVRERGDRTERSIRLNKADDFFAYLEDAPPGCDEKWM